VLIVTVGLAASKIQQVIRDGTTTKSNAYPRWVFLFRPYIRSELPGWGWLTKTVGIQVPIDDRRWDLAPTKIVRGKLHGYQMELDLRDWSERLTYFLGRYYELGVQRVLTALLRPGDRFVDIGTNIGMISLLGARLVSEEGRVDSFEPNPEALQVLKKNIDLNSIEHIVVHPVGLADKNGRMTLRLSSRHSGTATLGPVPDSETVKSFEVEVRVADDILLAESARIRLIKIDVEGFELNVIRGLKKTLERDRPFLVTEFVAEQFEDSEGSFGELLDLLEPIGFRPYGIATKRSFLRYALCVVEIARGHVPEDFSELLWARPDELASAGITAATD